MREVPSWVETLRGVIFVLVWTVLILRIPAVRRRPQRPAWVVLMCLAIGSVVIQADVAQWIDGATGVAHLSELVVAMVALTDFAAVWWFALQLHRAAHPELTKPHRAPLVAAGAMALVAVLLFFITPEPDRFAKEAHGWWIAYAIAWIAYGATTAIGAAAIFWRTARAMRSPILRFSMLTLALGVGAELPYLAIRAVRWFVPGAPAELAVAGFWFSFTRFVVVALACSIAALEPMRKGLLYWVRRQRLYRLWSMLRKSTPQLVLQEPRSRTVDLMSFGNNWELLHQRVVEIRDSITFLYDGWATPRLLREAADYAAKVAEPGHERLVAIACWIEATRREATTGAPRFDQESSQDLLPDVRATASTMRREASQLLKLRRYLNSRVVQDFADRQASSSPRSVS